VPDDKREPFPNAHGAEPPHGRAHSDVAASSRETVELDQQSTGRLTRMDAIERKAIADATHRLRQIETTQLNAAIKRIDDGEFGYCSDCGEEIEAARLSLNPILQKCLDCATG